jgi:methylated-DNA-[protein]-cysteine S-methyltransferase
MSEAPTRTAWTPYESPLGVLTIVRTVSGALNGLRFPGGAPLDPADRREMPDVVAQLDEYFAGERREFDLDVELSGTPFQLRVWERLREIPYGSTASYGEVAADLDREVFPSGLEPHERARAVGTEIGRTPVPIVVPCHRVVGADGSLIGYGGGLERKQALLELESSQLVLL